MAIPIAVYKGSRMQEAGVLYSEIELFEKRYGHKREVLVYGDKREVLGTVTSHLLMREWETGRADRSVERSRRYFKKPIFVRSGNGADLFEAIKKGRSAFVLKPEYRHRRRITVDMIQNEVTNLELAKVLEILLFGNPPYLEAKPQ